jgi:hypothetical protein
MKKLINKFIGTAGILLLLNCSAIKELDSKKFYFSKPKIELKSLGKKFYDFVRDNLVMTTDKNSFLFGYDTNGDGTKDLQLSYEISDVSPNGLVYLKLKEIREDTNFNGIWDDEEGEKKLIPLER